MKVLVIEDAPEIVESVSLTLHMSRSDAEILNASGGESGIYLTDTESPSMVILDVELPDLDGFTVCKEIRRFSDVPIIILTVRAFRDVQHDGIRGSFDLAAQDIQLLLRESPREIVDVTTEIQCFLPDR